MVRINYEIERDGEEHYIKVSDVLDAIEICSKEFSLLLQEEMLVSSKEILLSKDDKDFYIKKSYSDGYKDGMKDCMKIIDNNLSWIKPFGDK